MDADGGELSACGRTEVESGGCRGRTLGGGGALMRGMMEVATRVWSEIYVIDLVW